MLVIYEMVLLYELYELFVVALLGKTIGRERCSIRVVRYDDGELPGSRSLVRWSVLAVPPVLASLVIAAIPVSSAQTHDLLVVLAGTAAWLIVSVSPAWDDNRRGWHDKIAGTIVIHVLDPDARPHRPPTPQSARPEPADSQRPYGLVSDYYALGPNRAQKARRGQGEDTPESGTQDG